MKWFLIGLAGVVCSTTWVRGDAAGDLYQQGVDALADHHYDVAAKAFDEIMTGYPNTPNIDDVRIRAGFAYFYVGDFPSAIDRLAKEAGPTARPEYRGTGLYFTAMAQFSQGLKLADKDKAQADKSFAQAAATLTTLIDYIAATPTPDNKDYLEDAIYYRSLSQYERQDYADAEKDLLQLLQQFPASLKRPDYLFLLGSVYAVETNQAVAANNDPKTTGKNTPDEIKALAQKALDRFGQVSSDPNALVQANDANMSSAEILYLLAQLEPGMDGYQKAIDAFRLVRRKDDMVQLQETRLAQLKQASRNALQNNPNGASLANENSRLINREEGRLADLKAGADPIISALIRMAECYVAMRQADEARTILRRLDAHATLTPDQQQEVDFQLLYSYVLGGETDKADKALTDYLSKHASDPQADAISYLIGNKLLERKDYTGALHQAERSLKDFPEGKHVADVIGLKAQALTKLNKLDEADAVVDNFLKDHPTSPAANGMFVTKAQGEAARGDYNGALADYQKVRDNTSASAEMQAFAAAGYIQTLQSLQKYDDVISESKAFATKYPESKALPGVLLVAGLAMDQKHDPGAVAALQDVARKFPKDDSAAYALFYIVIIDQRTGNLPLMLQAVSDLRTAYPTAYAFLAQAADVVSVECLKEKKFDEAIALYQPLTDVPKPDVAAAARNKIGDVWLAEAKAMGSYQSMQVDARADAEKRLASSQDAYLAALKNFPDQLNAVGDAFDGLNAVMKLRRSWGLLTDANMEGYLGKLTADLATPEMQTRVELAKAALVFVYKNGDKQYPAALGRFKKAIGANAGLSLTRQETDQYGELLLAAQDYATALQVYSALLENAAPTDQLTQADGDYGMGATYLAQGDVDKAAGYFGKMKLLAGGAAWHPHIQEVDYGLALAAERAGDPNGLAMKTYARLLQAPVGIPLQSKATLGYGRLLEKAGYGVKPANPGTIEFAVHYYQQVHLLYGSAVPELSAEGLFDAGQVYEKAGDKADAKKQYTDLITAYGQTAPDWAAKAQTALTNLGS